MGCLSSKWDFSLYFGQFCKYLNCVVAITLFLCDLPFPSFQLLPSVVITASSLSLLDKAHIIISFHFSMSFLKCPHIYLQCRYLLCTHVKHDPSLIFSLRVKHLLLWLFERQSDKIPSAIGSLLRCLSWPGLGWAEPADCEVDPCPSCRWLLTEIIISAQDLH